MRKGKLNNIKKENKMIKWSKDHAWEILLVNFGYALACIVDMLMHMGK